MGTTSAGHLSAPAARVEGSNSPRGVLGWVGAPVAGHPQSLFHPQPVKMAELLHRRRHATALGQHPARDSRFLLSPSSLCLRYLLEPKCHPLHLSATPELSGLSLKPAGGCSRSKPTSTRMAGASSSQILQNQVYPPPRPLRLCRVAGLNPVLRPLGVALQRLAPQ